MSTQNIGPGDRDFENSVKTRSANDREVAYRNGYANGKVTEQIQRDRQVQQAQLYEENARLRNDNGASLGLVIGMLLAATAVVVGAIVYMDSGAGNQGAVTPTAPTPEATTPPPAPETTVIERTIERTQEVVPTPVPVQPPQVNVEVTPPPVEQVSPAPAPVAPPSPVSEPAPAPAPQTNEPVLQNP